jgi:cell division protein FtsL
LNQQQTTTTTTTTTVINNKQTKLSNKMKVFFTLFCILVSISLTLAQVSYNNEHVSIGTKKVDEVRINNSLVALLLN